MRIRLLTSVVGDGPVTGDVDDELDVDDQTAEVWADGVRAVRVEETAEPDDPPVAPTPAPPAVVVETPVVPVPTVAVVTATPEVAPPAPAAAKRPATKRATAKKAAAGRGPQRGRRAASRKGPA